MAHKRLRVHFMKRKRKKTALLTLPWFCVPSLLQRSLRGDTVEMFFMMIDGKMSEPQSGSLSAAVLTTPLTFCQRVSLLLADTHCLYTSPLACLISITRWRWEHSNLWLD